MPKHRKITYSHHPKKYLIKIIPLLFLLAVLPFAVWLATNITHWFSDADTLVQVDQPINKKVMLLIYNPIIESQGGRRLNSVKGWQDPRVLTQNFISTIRTVSGGVLNYQVVQELEVDDFPVKENGYDFTDETYLSCVSSRTCDSTRVDYRKELTDYQLCEKRNSGVIDEVWVWGGPWFGYYESRLAGLGAFWYNSPALTDTTCTKQLPMMGWNYERGLAEAMESYAHRVESVMKQVYGSWDWYKPTHAWNRFTLYDKNVPGQAGCGNVHYPPNGQTDYNWNNTTAVASNCDDWANYPNLTYSAQSFNCARWGCNSEGYLKWWFSHIPHFTGHTNGIRNDWWHYVADYPGSQNIPGLTKFKIAAAADDSSPACYDYNWNPWWNEVYIGWDTNCTPNKPFAATLHFKNIPYPRGTVIKDAFLEVNADGLYTNPLGVQINSTGAGVTSVPVTWSIQDNWNFDTILRTPSIRSQIQHILGQSSWNPGGEIVVTITVTQGTGHHRFFAYERDPNKAARLVVEIDPNALPPSPFPIPPTPSPSIRPAPTPSPLVSPKPSPSSLPTCPSRACALTSLTGALFCKDNRHPTGWFCCPKWYRLSGSSCIPR